MKVSFSGPAPRRKGKAVTLRQLEKNPNAIPPGQIQVKSHTHLWHVGVYVGYSPEVRGPAVVHFQNAFQDKKVPAVGPGQVYFQHLREFLAPYNTDSFEYVPNDMMKRGPRPPHEIVQRAMAARYQGFGDYNCAINNCEDFALQCVYYNPPLLSDQTKGYAAAATGVLGGVVIGTLLQAEKVRVEVNEGAEAKIKASKQRKNYLMPACLSSASAT